MKYLKYFEEVEWKDLNIGDYITFDFDIVLHKSYPAVYNRDGYKIIVRKNYPYKIIDIKSDDYFTKYIYIKNDDNKLMKVQKNEYNIKKISKEEAECIINAEKYNL